MLWVGDVGDWRGVVSAEGGGEIGEGRRTWALWKWLGSWLCLLSLGAPRRRTGLTASRSSYTEVHCLLLLLLHLDLDLLLLNLLLERS